MSNWLDIIGMTEAGRAALSGFAVDLIANAEVIAGPERHIAEVNEINPDAESVVWQPTLKAMIDQALGLRGRRAVILASGDPNWFGIGSTLRRHLDPEEFAIHPAPSSFQLAVARLGWPMQNCVQLSLHARAPEKLHPHILPGNRIVALTSDATTLHAVADMLVSRGFGQSRLSVLENLGGPEEKITSFPASEAMGQAIGDFYVLGIDCIADADAPLLPPVPGLADSAFESDGQLTKSDVRAMTLARLQPVPGALLWDVGAGSGSVGIEWMRAARDANAICFERDTERCARMRQNALRLGAPDLEIVEGSAPEKLAGQAQPDAVFLGGGVADPAVFTACWAALKAGGRLVANAVTLDGEAALIERQAIHGGTLTRIEISVLDQIGAQRVMRPRMAVLQWQVVKT